jgi:L-alanine-DL-glutamate epimerase-like enolase superfamily enzyme
VASQVECGLAQGYRHFKMKVGKALENDIRSSRFILQEYVGKDVTVRFDANQAYSLEEAVTYCSAMEDLIQDDLLWLEQPLDKDDWEGMKTLYKRVCFPMILDECIYNEEDIARAKDVGCTGIKLKLFKHLGMNSCLRLARVAHDYGLKVTIGNGVASDIGNLCEALVISSDSDLFVEGAECNGYVKLMSNIAFPDLVLRSGSLVWNGPSVIDFDAAKNMLCEESVRLYG